MALAAASGVTSIAQGAIQGGKARKLRSEYDAAEKNIPLQDPNQVAFLGNLRQRRRSFDAGTDPLTQFTMQQSRDMGAQTQANMVRSGVGNVNNLLRSQAGTNRAIGAAGARASQMGASMYGMEGQLVGAMADRAYNRQLSNANRLWSEYARAREDSNSNIQAGIGMLVGGGMSALDMAGGFGGGGGGGKVRSNTPLNPVQGQMGNEYQPGQAPWWNSF